MRDTLTPRLRLLLVVTLVTACFTGLGCRIYEPPIKPTDGDADGDSDGDTDGDADGDADGDGDGDADGDADGDSDSDADITPDADEDADESDADIDADDDTPPVVDPFCDYDVMINEVDGSGEDFIEIYNASAAPVDIGLFLITDESGGLPDVAGGVEIPAGTTIGPGEFIYLWANQETLAEPGFSDHCIAGAPTPCLNASWGISRDGEQVFLLSSFLDIVCQVASPSISSSLSWGRFPDGSATLVETTPTPGRPNIPF